MSGLSFDRPTGAAADVKELEYVIALQQTSEATRKNATVSSMDIMALLKSRYNLNITHKQAVEVVRTLGGGDTTGDPAVLKDSALSKATKTGKEVLTNVWQKTSEEGSKMLQQLNWLKAKQEKGERVNEEHVNTLHNKIADDLRAHVMARAKSTRHLNFTPSDDDDSDDDSSDTTVGDHNDEEVEITFEHAKKDLNASHPSDSETPIRVDDNGLAQFASVEFTVTEDFSIGEATAKDPLAMPSAAAKKSVSFASQPSNETDEEDDVSSVEPEPLAEYLDTIQTLATLLTPAFAKIAHEAVLENEGGPSESRGRDEATTQDSEPSLGTKLKQRFLNYGRRKLKLTDEPPFPYTAKQILETARTALIQNVMTGSDDDNTAEDLFVDEYLVQLLLLSAGEVERATNEQLVREMVSIARSPSGFFDEAALRNAIASDLSEWDVSGSEVSTTFFYDVFGVPLPSIKTKLEAQRDPLPPRPRSKSLRGKRDRTVELGVDQSHSASLHLEPIKESSLSLDDPESGNGQKHVLEPEEVAQEQQKEDEQEQLSAFSRCCNYLFPVLTAHKRGTSDFSTAFLGTDLIVDASASLTVHVLIWVFYVLTIAVYGSLLVQAPRVETECTSNEFGCKISGTIAAWALVAALLITFGFVYVLPLSIGNNPADQTARRTAFASIFAVSNSVWPFVLVNWLEDNPDRMQNQVLRQWVTSDSYDHAQNVVLATGCALGFIFFVQAVLLVFIDMDHPLKLPKIVSMIATNSSWNREIHVHHASRVKIRKLLSNALSLHVDSDQTTQSPEQLGSLTRSNKLALSGERMKAMRNFVLRGESKEEVGGVMWTFWKIFVDGSLLKEEGLWIHTRLLTIQVAQVAISVFVTIFLVIFADRAADEADDFRARVEASYDLPNWIMDIFPEGWMIHTALQPAAFVAMVCMVLICLIYIPSSVATILKYRGGILPSLGSTYFQPYRKNVDMTYMNTANAIYGMVGCAALFHFAVGGIIFLFVWPITQDSAVIFTAWAIGLTITIMIKMFITTAFRKLQFRSFYRIKPAAARITSLALECWHIGLAGSVLLARITQFLCASLFWVGRIDVPFLSGDVVLFGYGFDYVPHHYWKDLLVHEAHRHPYIETLAQMYLMKLRHGDRFISEAGAAWRQLFVLALFPWLSRRRVFADERRANAELDAVEDAKMTEQENDALQGAKGMKQETVDVGEAVATEFFDVATELAGAGEDIVEEMGKTGKTIYEEGVAIAGMVPRSPARN